MDIQSTDLTPRLSKQATGSPAIFASAFFFYLSTLTIRWAASYVTIGSAYFVFGRLLLGFGVVSVTMLLQKKRLQPKKYHYLIGRTLTNTFAVFCFYKAVETGSLAEANILNMTYPLFVALYSCFFLRGQRDLLSMLAVAAAIIGIWMILAPRGIDPSLANMWGLCSGVTAAAAIIYLNTSRRYHDSQTILFYMFGLGSILMLIFFHNAMFIPNLQELFFLLICSTTGVLGQYLLTYGFLYVSAVEGSIISSSRILLAALLGPLLVSDPTLTIAGWCGALLIFSANAMLALRKI